MTTQLEERLQALEQEYWQWLRTDVSRTLAVTDEMMHLTEGAGPAARALALRAHGTALRLRGQLREALQAMTRSQKLWREAGDEVQWARTVTGMIPVLVQMDRYGAAVRNGEEALKLFVRHGDELSAARLLNNMGGLYGHMGRSHAALRSLTRGEELAARAGEQGLRARFNLNRAVVLQQMGRQREAVSACARALRYFLKAGERVSAARTLQCGAVALFQLGQFGKALRRFSRARSIFAASSAPRDVSVCDLYIVACYVELNRCEEALGRLHGVREVLNTEAYAFQRAWARMYEGMALARLGRTEEALGGLREAYEWFAGHGHAPWAGRAVLEKAGVRLGRGESREAIRSAAQAARLFAEARMPVDEARALLTVAEANLALRRIKEAQVAVNKAYPVFQRAQMPGPTFRCLHLMGRIALHQKDWTGARRLLTRAVSTAERTRATVQVAFRRAFLEDKSAAYADLVWLHLKLGRLTEAHRLADLAKSRALVDALAVPDERGRRLTRPSDLGLLAEIEAARRDYLALTAPRQLGPELAITLRGEHLPIGVQRRQAEQRLAALWDEWELRQAANVTAANRSEVSGSMWRRRLPEGGCLVEYFMADGRLIAFVGDRRGLRGWVDLGSPDEVRRDLELLQLNLDTTLLMLASGRNAPPGLSRNARALLGALYRRLWAPLLPLLGQRERAVVIPHGYLHLVPFEALHDGQSYLAEHLEISLAPSRAAWLRCLELGERPMPEQALVMGYNPDGALPFVEEEVRWVAGALGTTPHLGDEATTGLLLESGARWLLHVAVHGEFRMDNPHFSTLLLADGSIAAADAARLRLDAGLAVLSGCETGLSRVTRGEELMGMISAFLQAGCASVLASRWRVDDRITSELMHEFYTGLLAGKSKAAALRQAQANLAARDVHPLCWAAFGLVGHSGPLH